MYPFLSDRGRRRQRRTLTLLIAVICALVLALVGVGYRYAQSTKAERTVQDALYARAVSEAGSAQAAVYRLTQSSGANTTTLLATVRGHIYALQSLNTLVANIYGAGSAVADSARLDVCVKTLDLCESRLQSGLVITEQLTQLRDDVDALVAAYNGA